MIIERALVHLVLQQGKAIFCTIHTNNEQPSVLVTVHGNDTCLSRQLMCKITATSPRMLMASHSKVKVTYCYRNLLILSWLYYWWLTELPYWFKAVFAQNLGISTHSRQKRSFLSQTKIGQLNYFYAK